MYKLLTEIEIEASPARIWSILTDFEGYPDWNPFIRRVSGTPAAGARISVTVRPPGGRPISFRPVVLRCVDNRELSWRGRLPVPGLLAGERVFRIEPLAPGHSRFVHAEYFSGILAVALKWRFEGRVRAGFLEMNQALKSRAEHG